MRFFPAIALLGMLAISARADWQWRNDLVSAVPTPEGYVARFQFDNKEKNPLAVANVVFKCSCATFRYEATPAKPGGTGTLTVRIYPGANGLAEKELDLVALGPPSTSPRELTVRFDVPAPSP